jgi:hypothetical protein
MQKSLDLGTESKIGEIFRNWELNLQQKKKDFDSRSNVIIWMILISCQKETL